MLMLQAQMESVDIFHIFYAYSFEKNVLNGVFIQGFLLKKMSALKRLTIIQMRKKLDTESMSLCLTDKLLLFCIFYLCN